MRSAKYNAVIVLPVTRYEPIVEELIEGEYLHVVLVDCGSTLEDHMLLLNVMHKNPSGMSVIRVDDTINTSSGSVQGLEFALQAFPRADFFVQTEQYFNDLEELLRIAEYADIVVASSSQINCRLCEFILGHVAGMNPHFLFSRVRCYTSASLRSLALEHLKCTGIAIQAEISLRLWKRGYSFRDVRDDLEEVGKTGVSLINFSKLILIAMTRPSRNSSE